MRYMSLIRISKVLFILIPILCRSQLPAKVERMEGKWEYRHGSGIEIWTMKGDEMHAVGYRTNKLGDTLKVESSVIKKVNKQLVYFLNTFKLMDDSVVVSTSRFIGGKKKMEFFNLDAITPYSITYKFGFLRRKLLKVYIQLGPNDEQIKMYMRRVSE
jgi:hypothetical protein